MLVQPVRPTADSDVSDVATVPTPVSLGLLLSPLRLLCPRLTRTSVPLVEHVPRLVPVTSSRFARKGLRADVCMSAVSIATKVLLPRRHVQPLVSVAASVRRSVRLGLLPSRAICHTSTRRSVVRAASARRY